MSGGSGGCGVWWDGGVCVVLLEWDGVDALLYGEVELG